MRPKVESHQIRAARGLLDWTQNVLAERCGLGLRTVKRVEDETIGASEPSLEAVVAALEAGGVMFLRDGELGPHIGSGVALRPDGRRDRRRAPPSRKRKDPST